jgi:hypothetical protein
MKDLSGTLCGCLLALSLVTLMDEHCLVTVNIHQVWLKHLCCNLSSILHDLMISRTKHTMSQGQNFCAVY